MPIGFRQHESKESADTGRRQSRENGDWVNVAFIEDAENDVNSGESGDDQHEHRGLRVLKSLGSALKAAVNGGRHAQLLLELLNFYDGVAEGEALAEVEGQSNGRIETLVIDRERGV